MRKRFLCLAIGAWVLCGSGLPAYAEDYTGGQGWQVEFTGEGMESSFTSSDISDAVYALQPGDSVTLSLSLKNSGPQDTDWYMANEVLSSLEDSQGVAGGGAYTYRLAYTGNIGEEEVLFSSENVGGEKTPGAGVGLHEATESLEEFFYLDRLGPGDGGTVTLRVVLDGETQGNTYQNTLASLQMNFAVEKAGAVPGTEEEGSTPGGAGQPGGKQYPWNPATVWGTNAQCLHIKQRKDRRPVPYAFLVCVGAGQRDGPVDTCSAVYEEGKGGGWK